MQLVDDDAAQVGQGAFLQHSIDDGVGLFDGADGEVGALHTPRRGLGAHEAADADGQISEEGLRCRRRGKGGFSVSYTHLTLPTTPYV